MKRGDWKRHYIINRPADWLRDIMADPARNGPEKAAAYAVSVSIDKATLDTFSGSFRTDHSQAQLAQLAGAKPRAFRDALGGLQAAGYLQMVDRGRLANGYRALFPAALVGRNVALQTRELSGGEPPHKETRRRRVTGQHVASQNDVDAASDIPLTSNLSGRKPHVVRQSNVTCGAEKRTLSGRILPNPTGTVTGNGGAACGRATPTVVRNDIGSGLRSSPQLLAENSASRAAPEGARSASDHIDDDTAFDPAWDEIEDAEDEQRQPCAAAPSDDDIPF